MASRKWIYLGMYLGTCRGICRSSYWVIPTIALMTAPLMVQASIMNGDFSNGFNSWVMDTDGGSGANSDFSIVNGAARVEADFYSTPGDLTSTPLNEVFFGNSLLSHTIDLTGSSAPLTLQFDYRFDGEDGNSDGGERFSVFFSDNAGNAYGADGQLGFLLAPTTDYDTGTFLAQINPLDFSSLVDLNVSFLLEVGTNSAGLNNGLGSAFTLDNVSLSPAVPISEPAMLSLMLMGLGTLIYRRRKKH